MYENIVEAKDQEIRKLLELNNDLEKRLVYVLKENENISKDMKNNENQSLLLKSENQRIKEKITEAENALEDLILDKTSKGALLLENECLKNDVERLLQLLQQTSEVFFQN
jgi:hypothetical protein